MNRRTFVVAALRLGVASAFASQIGARPAMALLAAELPSKGSRKDLGEHPDVSLVKRFYQLYDARQTDVLQQTVLTTDAVWEPAGHDLQTVVPKDPQRLLAMYGQFAARHTRGEGVMVRPSAGLVLDVHRGRAPDAAATDSQLWVLAFAVREGRIASIRTFAYDGPVADGLFKAR